MNTPSLLNTLCLLLISTSCISTTSTVPIPVLNDKGDGKGHPYKSEGPTDWEIYEPALGVKKVLMLYVDFPNAKQEIDTKGWGNKGQRDKDFVDLFRKQSYGKISMQLHYVHGWRTLPKDHTEYGTKTTDAHRDLFVDVFALYPEINFFDYDYIVANMSKLGNVAFGERDEIAIPYKDGKIRLAINIGSQGVGTLVHEVGHVMGLPDVYTYGDLKPQNPMGKWDVMSSAGKATGFCGWHRHKFGWLDDNRKTYHASGSQEYILTSLDENNGLSMIVVPDDDKTYPSKVFVIELSRGIQVDKELAETGGVIIYSVDATLPTGQNMMVIYPKTDKIKAPFHPGDTFAHKEAPMTVMILEKLSDGRYKVNVTAK